MKKTIKTAISGISGLAFLLLLIGIAGTIEREGAFPWIATILCVACGFISRLLW